jgi:hypothetical protein
VPLLLLILRIYEVSSGEDDGQADNYFDDLIVVILDNPDNISRGNAKAALSLEFISRPPTRGLSAATPYWRALRRSKNNHGMDPPHPSTHPVSTDRQVQGMIGRQPQNDHRQVLERRQIQ